MKTSRRQFLMAAGMVGAAAKMWQQEARGAQAPQQRGEYHWGDPYEYLPQARAADHREILPPEAIHGPWRNLRAVQQKKVIDFSSHSSETRTQSSTYRGTDSLREEADIVDFTESLVESMDRHGIAKTCLIPVAMAARTQFPEIVRSKERYPGRFEVWGGLRNLQPRPVGREAARILREQLTQHGAVGVGEGAIPRPDNSRSSFRDEDLKPFMEVVMEFDVPVLIDPGGWSASRRSGSSYSCGWRAFERFGNMVAQWPDVKWVLIHSGGSFDHLDGYEALRVAYSFENIYMDTSKTTARIITEAVKGIGAERLVYGSDWNRPEMKAYGPFHYRMAYQHWWGLNQIAMADITEEQRDTILYRTATRLLKLND